MRVLLMEANDVVCRSIELTLEHARLKVYAVRDIEEGADLARLYDYDIILLGVDDADHGHAALVNRMRTSGVETPILALFGSSGKKRMFEAFRNGADECLAMPFHREELLLRIQAVVRRSRGHSRSTIEIGPLVVDIGSKSARVEGRDVHLTMKEYQALELLAMRKGATVTKAHFLDHLYGGVDEPDVKIIDVFICKLRKKLDEATGGVRLIETVWGRGYTLRAPADEGMGLAAA